MINSFIWKGNDKIKRAALINDMEKGGLRMLDIQDHISSWKIILDFFPFRVGREFILKCNFDTPKLPVYLPAFYKECPDAWTLLNDHHCLRTEMLSIRSFGLIGLSKFKESRFTKSICF